jgi:hypothetical protein
MLPSFCQPLVEDHLGMVFLVEVCIIRPLLDRLCGLAMIHVHRNDAVGQVIPEAVLKRRDSSGNRKIHLAFTDLVLSFEIVH